jgi:hypothetical protein
LNEEQLLTAGSDSADLSTQFMGHGTEDEVLEHVRTLSENVLAVINGN